jgi:hypothetical protein
MFKPRWILLATASMLCALSAHAQDKPATPAQGQGSGSATAAVRVEGGGVVGAIIGNVGPGFGGVQGAPFSAEVIDESEQFLADGNRIHRETHGRIFRDSQGRTRTLRVLACEGPATSLLSRQEPWVMTSP